MFYVYKHTCPNNKVYIGITCQKPTQRWSCGRGYKNNMYFTRAINKYKWENIKHEILYENLTKEEAEEKEVELISQYKSNKIQYGYNIEYGGCHNGKTSERTKKLISLHHKKPNLGKHLSQETKEKIRQANIGRKLSDEAKKKLSECRKGKTSYNKGIKKTEEQKYQDMLNQKTRKKIICLETQIVYESVRQACRLLNIPKTSLQDVLKKKNKTTHGLRFEYVKEENK